VPTTTPDDIQQYLLVHNTIREEYNATDLTWSNDLQGLAQGWASGCKFEHSNGALGPVGENLVAGTGSFSAMDAVEQFLSDKDASTFTHFSQVVWKATTQLGCAWAQCDIFGQGYPSATYHVCLYNPVGNVIGEQQLNVQD